MNYPEQQISTSALIFGAGGSGLRAAIELAERGVDVLVVSKRPRADAHTSLAAGEEGSTTTPFDMVVRNGLDRFHLVMDVAERVPSVGPHGPHVRQTMHDRLVEHREYITRHGLDLPDVRDWSWPYGLATAAETPEP